MAFDPGRDNPSTGNYLQTAWLASALASVCLLLPAVVTAVEVATAPADTMVVQAAALVDAVTPSAGGVVTRIDLEDAAGGMDLARELSRVAGLQVRRYGGIGFAAVPALRGAAAAQIRFFLDGMPLNSAQTGQVDLSRLPAASLEAAEVHRGQVPAGWGGMGGAGAINLVTRKEARGTELGFFAGSFGDVGGRINWGTASEDLRSSILLMAHGRKATNDYSYNDHNQTFNNATDDTTRNRENAWFEEWGIRGSGRHEVGRLGLQAAAGFFRKEGGRPGPLNYPSPNAAVRYQRGNAQLNLNWDHNLQNLQLVLAGAVDRQYLYDPQNEIDDGFGGSIHSCGEDVTARLNWSGPLYASKDEDSWLTSLDALAGVEERRQWYEEYYDDQADPMRSRSTTSAFAGLTLSMAASRFQLMPAWRWQRNQDDFPPVPALPWLPEEELVQHQRDDISPSLGALWNLVPEKLSLQSNWSNSVRVPTWIELFGHRGGIDGNRDLAPEEIEAADIALTWQPDNGLDYLRLAVFSAQTDQTIVFVQNSPGSSSAMNIGKTRNHGLEFELGASAGHGLKLNANLTWQNARDKGDDPAYADNHLPYLSDLTSWLRLSGGRSSWQCWGEWSWQSEKFRDRANLSQAPAHSIVNVGLGWGLPGDGFSFLGGDWTTPTLSGEIINILNDRTYDVEQFPLPGRSFQLSLKIQG